MLTVDLTCRRPFTVQLYSSDVFLAFAQWTTTLQVLDSVSRNVSKCDKLQSLWPLGRKSRNYAAICLTAFFCHIQHRCVQIILSVKYLDIWQGNLKQFSPELIYFRLQFGAATHCSVRERWWGDVGGQRKAEQARRSRLYPRRTDLTGHRVVARPSRQQNVPFWPECFCCVWRRNPVIAIFTLRYFSESIFVSWICFKEPQWQKKETFRIKNITRKQC